MKIRVIIGLQIKAQNRISRTQGMVSKEEEVVTEKGQSLGLWMRISSKLGGGQDVARKWRGNNVVQLGTVRKSNKKAL